MGWCVQFTFFSTWCTTQPTHAACSRCHAICPRTPCSPSTAHTHNFTPAGQIKALEAQLAGLRSQAAELDDRRSSVASRLKSALAAASGGQAAASAVQVPPSHYQEELAAADKLAALVDPSASLGDGAADAVAAVRAANQDTAWHYQQSCRQLLIMGADALAEVPAKVAFAKQRKEKVSWVHC